MPNVLATVCVCEFFLENCFFSIMTDFNTVIEGTVKFRDGKKVSLIFIRIIQCHLYVDVPNKEEHSWYLTLFFQIKILELKYSFSPHIRTLYFILLT